MQVRTEKKARVGPTVWRFDPSHSVAEFSIRKFFFLTIVGRLTALEGTIVLDESEIERSSVAATFKADSIDTGNRRRDAHLRSSHFLAAEDHPNIHFQSSRVGSGKDRDMLSVTGVLTIKGKSGEVVLDVTEVDRSRSPQGEEVIYYTAATVLDRRDWGIDYWRGVIGRKLKVTISVQASRPL